MKTNVVPNESKLKELILYIAAKSATDPRFGAVKLNKILFHADFMAFGLFGKAMTGVEYMKLEHGPGPRRLVPVRDEMMGTGDIVIQPQLTYVPWIADAQIQQRVVPLRDPDLGQFSSQEIALVDAVLKLYEDKTGTELSELTHGYRGWLVARELRDTIPYSAVFLSDEPPTDFEIIHTGELVEKYGWDA